MKAMTNYFERQSYMQSPILNRIQRLNEQMKETLSQPSLPADIRAIEYSQLLDRFLDLQQQVPHSSSPKTTQLLAPLPAEGPQQHSTFTPIGAISGSPPIKSKILEQQLTPLSQPQLLSPSPLTVESKELVSPAAFITPTPSTPTNSLSSPSFLTPPPSSEKQNWFSYIDSNPEKAWRRCRGGLKE
jgi:hypothetical protein